MVFRKLRAYGELVMFSHTIFSFSFAIVAILLMSKNYAIELTTFIWIIVALLSARTGANALNRVIDANIDTLNPRTANRQIPQNRISIKEVMLLVLTCFAIMIYAASQLNTLSLLLAPIALFLMIIYSYTKRFTWLCHLILGLTCACAPVGAIIAITGQISFLALVIGAANMFWVAGFDIMYGAQDYDFDIAHGLYSIPAYFGVKNALLIARLFHLITFFALLLLYFIANKNLNIFYLFGLSIIGALFIYQHKIISSQNLKQVRLASYHVNQIISVVFLFFSTLAIVV